MALRSILNEDVGRKIRKVRIVVFKRDDQGLSDAAMQEIVSRVAG